MKSIRKELVRNNFILLICAGIFLICNIMVYSIVAYQQNQLLQNYEQINELVLINNERKTSFKLYCKSHEEIQLDNYYKECHKLNQKLELLSEKMEYDNNCKMMFRLVGQVLEHSEKVAEQYIIPEKSLSSGTVNYLDEVDLELERCMNQLVNHYLDFWNEIFEAQNYRLKSIVIGINILLLVGCSWIGIRNYYINSKILESINRISEAAIAITNKNFEAEDIEESSFIELNQVSATFDHMKHTIKDMIIEINEKHQMKEHLAEAKIRELQMQMNPHFLFNTLNLVVRNIQKNEKETSIQLINAISKILRSSIEIKTLAIPLDDEIDLLEAYLYIQKLHLSGRVTFYIDVRKSFGSKDIKIPPLTIQPLVENSIQHGLKDKLENGRVEVVIVEKTDYIEVMVSDNGSGFKETEIKKKQEKLQKTSIGLNNVRERLKLYYHQEDVMKIERIENMTRITLKLYKGDKMQI